MAKRNKSRRPASGKTPPLPPPPPAGAIARSTRTTWLIGIALVLLTVAVFGQVRSHDFVDLDDTGYVVQNPHVTTGLTTANVQWAFTPTGYAANWHPLTWMSHQIDASLFGANAGPQHLVNLGWHVANVLLLFALLRFMTGALWRSAFVAAAFAVHPTHVESVAWIAERKDVLSTFFWFATTFLYVAWVRRPESWRYGAMIALFVLGLMAKPMLVTLPFTLLLLDIWPLERTSVPLSKRLVEKLPLLALALASSYVTAIVQQKGGAVGSLELVPMSMRLANAAVAYAHYLRVLVWPSGLAVFYPYIKQLPSVSILISLFGLATISAMAWRMRRDQPAILVGWLWFLGTLVPVIGLVQIGTQAYADRYTYIPYVGLFVAIAWTAVRVAARARIQMALLGGVGLIAVLACAVVAHAQTATWRNAETLWLQAVSVTPNARGHDQLGVMYARRGELAKASAEFQLALQSSPDPSDERLIEPNLGRSLVAQGKVAEALPHLLRAIQYQPDQAEFRHQLALAYIGLDRPDDAVAAWREAVRLDPNYEDAYYAMGIVLASRGHNTEAVRALQEVLRINPSRTDAREAIKNLSGK